MKRSEVLKNLNNLLRTYTDWNEQAAERVLALMEEEGMSFTSSEKTDKVLKKRDEE